MPKWFLPVVGLLGLTVVLTGVGGQELPPGLPEGDVEALMQQVNALAAELRTEAERLIGEEGAEAAIERLRGEAHAEPRRAFERLTLAAVAAMLADQEETAEALIADETPAATDQELRLALARHMIAVGSGLPRAREASGADLVWQGEQGESIGTRLDRQGVILSARRRLATDPLEEADFLYNVGYVQSHRGDLASAQEYYRRALALRERLAPGSAILATSLNSVGYICHQRGDLKGAVRYYERCAALRQRLSPDSAPVASVLTNLGNLHLEYGNPDAALEPLERALAISEQIAPDSLGLAAALNSLGGVHQARGDLEAALRCYQSSLEIRERLTPDSLEVAGTLGNIGAVHNDRGDLGGARGCYERALALAERLAPDSLAVATALNNVGSVRMAENRPEAALECYARSLEIRQRIAPDTPEVAIGLDNLGLAYARLGDLDTALTFYERGLTIEERLAPDSLGVAGILNSIGCLHANQGALEAAQACHRRALAIRERLAPDSLAVASSLNNLGSICDSQGDLEEALKYYRRALAINARRAPDSLAVAVSLNNIGYIENAQGALGAALEHYQQALAINERLAPDSLSVATSLHNIAGIHHVRGDIGAALAGYGRSLALREQLAPESLDVAVSLNNLGSVYSGEEDFGRGLEAYRRGLAIQERLAPDALCVAMSLCNISCVQAAQGDLAAAVETGAEAVERLERARGRSGSAGDHRSAFLAQNIEVYSSLIELQVEAGQVDAAATTAERMRARGFLELAAERSLGTTSSPALRGRQQTLDVRRDRLYGELQGGGTATPDDARVAAITAQLQQIALDQEALKREVRQSDPRYAALQYPEPMTAQQLRQSLDPGTLVLMYVVGVESTRLFILGPGVETQVREISLTESDLRRRVGFLLGLLEQKQEVAPVARSLGEALLWPAAAAIAQAERVLVLPDGPLWQLPFHALPLENNTCLCDAAPVHYASSGTVLLEGRKLREGGRIGERLLAYGAPDYSAADRAGAPASALPIRSGVFRSVRRGPRGTRLAALPESRLEAEAVAELFAGNSDTREGAAATEASLRREASGRRVVHVACHGLLDPASPMDSALVLSLPENPVENDDGFLKTWEVFGLDLAGCDLVTLSACETAKGKTLSGEGVVGLTRAFLYAGAASVLCTQWKVADDSTAALMYCFYRHYRAGASKDVALQQAMRELRTGRSAQGSPLKLPAALGRWQPAWSHPYYWAAFIVMGEYLQTTGGKG
jgi:tetratricopeptide (TPR) repeat protein/CHAT domain-containing protein